MGAGKYILTGILCWGGLELGESLLFDKAARAEESWRAAVNKLTPEEYRKDSDEFEKRLQALQRFLWDKTQAQENKEIVLEALVSNLSLRSKSLPNDIKISDNIRDMLIRAGVLDFKKKLEDIADDIAYETGMINALERFCNNENSNDVESNKNIQAARNLIEIRRDYISALQKESKLLMDAMFLLRWHYPAGLKKEIDYQGVYIKCKETMGEISLLSEAIMQRNFPGVLDHLEEYVKKHHSAQSYFEENIGLARNRAEISIMSNLNILEEVGYEGKSYFSTADFAKDWEGIGGAVGLARKIERAGKPETKQPPKVAARTETKPPIINNETTNQSKQTKGIWNGIPSRAALEQRLYEITHNQELLEILVSDFNGDINRFADYHFRQVRDFTNANMYTPGHPYGLLGKRLIPIIKSGVESGKDIASYYNLSQSASSCNFEETDKKQLTDLAIRAISSNNPRAIAYALESLYYLEYPGAGRLARKFIYYQAKSIEDSILSERAVSILARLQDPDIKDDLMEKRHNQNKSWIIGNRESLFLFGTDDTTDYLEQAARKTGFGYSRGNELLPKVAPNLRDFYRIYNSPKGAREKLEELGDLLASISYFNQQVYRINRDMSKIGRDIYDQIEFKLNRLPPETALITYELFCRERDKYQMMRENHQNYGQFELMLQSAKKSVFANLTIQLLDDLFLRNN